MKSSLASLLTASALVLPLSMPTAHAAEIDGNTPIARVNGVAIPVIHAAFIKQSRVNRGANPETLTDESIRDALISMEVMVQEALRKNLDKEASVAAALDLQRKELLSQAAVEDYARANPVDEALVRAEYDKAKATAGDNEYRVRHILVDNEKEARTIIQTLARKNKPPKFEELAKKHSKDSSAQEGGDLGWVLPANVVPEFANAMVKLKKADFTRIPVKSEFGWHVIKLEDSRKLEFPSYEELRGRIAGQIRQQMLRRYISEVRSTARIELIGKP